MGAGTDGTPNESIQDVLVRVRQLMSITETQVRPEGVVWIIYLPGEGGGSYIPYRTGPPPYRPPRTAQGPPCAYILQWSGGANHVVHPVVPPPSPVQYSGQDVLLIAPDSYTLSAVQAAALGVDMKLHGMYGMGPGEVRMQCGQVNVGSGGWWCLS